MSRRDPKITLRQIKQHAERAQALCAGRLLEELLADWQATLAFERAIEVLGEAVKRLPTELRELRPEIPWKEIAGTRDFLTHGYDAVDYQLLWDAVKNDVPPLLAAVEAMLREFG